jgi:hypothetical protein
MGKPYYYRADKRDFEPGDIIRTAGDFLSMHDPFCRAVEKVLELNRPVGKTPRGKCLFLFLDRSAAEEYGFIMRKPIIYQVTIRGEILHRADLSWFPAMITMLKRGQCARAQARRYWNGQLTKHPLIEVLAGSATIVERIVDNIIQQREEEEDTDEFMREFWESTGEED